MQGGKTFLHKYTNPIGCAEKGGASWSEPQKIKSLISPENGLFGEVGFPKLWVLP